jgi:uncharacterized membrane protein YkgB
VQVPKESAVKEASPSIEAEFANMFKYMDLYARQKIDLYIQHYMLDPLDFILKEIIYLSVVASLLVVGTIALTVGIIVLISTFVSLWVALIACGVVAIMIAAALSFIMFSRELILKTPKYLEADK